VPRSQPCKARSLRVLRRPSQTIESLVPVSVVGLIKAGLIKAGLIKAGPAMLAEENCVDEVVIVRPTNYCFSAD